MRCDIERIRLWMIRKPVASVPFKLRLQKAARALHSFTRCEQSTDFSAPSSIMKIHVIKSNSEKYMNI